MRRCDMEKCMAFIEQAGVQKLGIIFEHSLHKVHISFANSRYQLLTHYVPAADYTDRDILPHRMELATLPLYPFFADSVFL